MNAVLCFVVCIIISLIINLVLYVCIYGVRGGMHDRELLEDRGRGDTVLVVYIFHRRKAVPATKMFVGPGQSSDVEPGGHDEQGQGRTAFHKFMQILGKVFLGPHRAGWCRSSLGELVLLLSKIKQDSGGWPVVSGCT